MVGFLASNHTRGMCSSRRRSGGDIEGRRTSSWRMTSVLAAGRRLVYRSIVLSTNIESLGGVQHGYFEYRLLPRIERQSEVRPRPAEEECGTCNCAVLSMVNAVVNEKKQKQQQRRLLNMNNPQMGSAIFFRKKSAFLFLHDFAF